MKWNKNKQVDTDWQLPGEEQWGQGKMVKGGQVHRDGWKLDFGGEHAVVCTKVEL